MKQHSITIGIPALNEGANILTLLSSLTTQTLSCGRLTQILVVSDGSTDNTVSQALLCNDSRVKVIIGETRLGKAARLNEIISMTNTDVLVLVDGDIAILQPDFLERLITPIVLEEALLSSAALREKAPRNFFESVLYVSMRLKDNLFAKFKHGNNAYNCHGPARALSKHLYKLLSFRTDSGEDMYSYLYCAARGLNFKFVPGAIVYYRLPDNFHDYMKQSTRYHGSKLICPANFEKKLVERELDIPLPVWIAATITSIPLMVRNFVRVGFYLMLLTVVRLRLLLLGPMNESWNVSSSKLYL